MNRRANFTDLIVHYIAVRQDPSGGWVDLGVSRPPIEESSITRTAMAIRALKIYGWPAREAEFSERIQRASQWLQNTKPATTYEWADKIAGLQRRRHPGIRFEQRVRRAVASCSDPMAVGHRRHISIPMLTPQDIVLHTLYTAGMLLPNDPIYRKGVNFLLRTQFPDGSWYVRSRAPKFQPYFQSGFPFDHDQWISSSATSLAVMALAPASAPIPYHE